MQAKYLHRQSEMFGKQHPGRRRSDRSFLVLILQTLGVVYVLFYLALGAVFQMTYAANEPPGVRSLSNRDTAALMEFVNTNRYVQRSHANGFR